MTSMPFDSDATRAAVTAAAQAMAAYCEREGIAITQAQCEELAVTVISHYQAFAAGVHYAAQAGTAAEPGT